MPAIHQVCNFVIILLLFMAADILLHPSAQKPLSLLQELFPLLRPVFFWLANTLELYQFFTTLCDPLEFPVPPPTTEDTTEETDKEDPLSTLYSILLYTFQQAFYSISKV